VARRGRPSRVDRGLQYLERRGRRLGLFGHSRGWLWVFVAAVGLRRFRRVIGSEYEVVWQGEVRPGETLEIGHRAETYDGRRVRSRRRKIRS
jgi:hypothetical protein